MLTARVISELRIARVNAGLTQAEVGSVLGIAASNVWRLEAGEVREVTVERLSEIASVVGYELAVNLYPVGDPLRDKGQLACGRRFEAMLADVWRVTDETLLPGAGEQRAWDKLLRLVGASPPYLVGVDIETRIRDVQALTRRTRERERDGQVDAILIVLADTATNRRLADELRASLGDAYRTAPRAIMRGLRSGERLVGSGVVLV
jgi:transcriptional regulator with XRE-family HTH domain